MSAHLLHLLHPERGVHIMRSIFILFGSICLTQGICRPGYQNLYNGKCFRYVEVALPWNDARGQCQADGGDLASIHRKEENDLVSAVIPLANIAWLGMSPGGGNFGIWSDNSELDYENIMYVVPITDYGPAIHATIHTDIEDHVGQWSFFPETTGYYYVCTVPQEIPSGPCDLNYEYQDELGLCLRKNGGNASWTDAERICQEDNAHLIAIHDLSSNTFIRRLALSNHFVDNIHIGLHITMNDGGVEIPTWTDQSPLDYENFDSGMPNSIFGECVAMEVRSVTGDWISIHCDDTAVYSFLCAKQPPCPSVANHFYQGDVYSPDYPSSPSRSINCEYFLAANNGSAIIMEFDEIQLIADDQIILYDGESSQTPMAVVRGDSIGKRYITQNENVLRVVYMTGTSVGIRKWHARFNNF